MNLKWSSNYHWQMRTDPFQEIRDERIFKEA